MADTYTEHLELRLIDPTSLVKIQDINENMKKIDDRIKTLTESIKSGELLPNASGVSF